MVFMDEQHALKGRKQSPEHVARKARKCGAGCTCKRHTSQQSEEVRSKHRENTKRKWETGLWEGRAEKSAATRAAWSPERLAEVRATMSEAKRKEWAEKGPDRNKRPGNLFRRTSAHERSLVPYLEALGYEHNSADDNPRFVSRRVPDFIDRKNRRVFEYLGTYWHPDPAEEQVIIDHYAKHGWSTTILWESELFEFLLEHKNLVTDSEHSFAWEAAKVNNGFRKPPETVIGEGELSPISKGE